MTDGSGMRAGLKGNVEEALRLFASEAEWAGLNLEETEFVLEETLKCYGATFDGEMIRELFKFYRRYLGMAPVGRRQQLLSRMTAFIADGHQHRSIALLCFISADTDGQITSGAALDLAMVMPPDKGDPLTGPKFVAFHGCGGSRAKLGRTACDDEGDVAAGLLLLGDMRLLPLLEEIWERLTPEGRRRMVRRRSNLVSALMVEFLLRRLEADKAEEYHGELGAALHNLPEIAAQLPMEVVMDIRRNFGLPPDKEPMDLLGRETLAEAFTRIRPRLRALVDRESEPKVLPGVLAKWAEATGGADANEAMDDLDELEDEIDAKISELRANPGGASEASGVVRYAGLLSFLAPFSLFETALGAMATVWALVCQEWVFALLLTVFSFGLAMKYALVLVRRTQSRWWAVINYGWMLAYMAYRMHRHNQVELMTGPAFLLVDVMTIWAGTMGLVYLGYFRFAQTMQEATSAKAR